MDTPPSQGLIPKLSNRQRLLLTICVFLAGLTLGAWLYFTPAGLLGKADAIAYAVCHRISARTFFLGNRQLPLCARCTGMHLGALLALVYQIPKRRRGGLPPLKLLVLLGIFAVLFAVDGINSYLQLFPTPPIHLYYPQNWLRLLTGSLLGLGIGLLILPVFNQTLWSDWVSEPAVGHFRQMAALVGLAILVDLMVLTDNPMVLYPLALLSSANVIVVLSMIYAVVWTLVFKLENKFQTIRQATLPLIAGLATTIVQIAVMDLTRYIITGTWGGFKIG